MLKLYKSPMRYSILLFCSFFTLPAFAQPYTVTNTNSSGAGSLAQAITDANNNPGADVIEFNLAGAGPFTINLAAALPTITTDPVFINGYSQPGAAQGPIATRTILININAAGSADNAFTVQTNGVTIAGLAIYGAPAYGIKALALPASVNNLHIWGNYIGTDNTGLATGLGNVGGAVEVNITSSVTPSDNIVVGIQDDGINDINEGNLITSSSSPFGNNGDGVLFWRCTNSTIAGNIIGLNKNGTGAGFGNFRDGIVVTVASTNVVIGTNGNGVSDALEANIIGNNGRNGILLAGVSTNNIIAGNTVGLNSANVAAGNGVYGIELLNASGNRIGTDGNGTSDLLERNIISSNVSVGFKISSESFFGFESSSDNNIVKGNIIGSDAGLTLVRPNGWNGIELESSFTFSVSNNFFGTDHDLVNDEVERNIIVNNAGNGIQVLAPTGGGAITGNKFSGNRIYNNDMLGIDLQSIVEFGGVTINDDGDGDTGPNDLFNAPVITSVQIDGSDLVVEGFTSPGSIVEFYIPDAAPNPDPLPGGFTKSFGQGETFLFRAQEGGTLNTITDNDATMSNYDGTVEGSNSGGTRLENKFNFRIPISSLPVAVTAGTRITTLAYLNASGAGSTSEFGGASVAANLPVHFTSFKGRVKDGKTFLTWTTAEEQNNSHFEVEKSTTGSNYTTIGKVNPKTGLYNQYDFTDETALGGINYYRLKQVDLDGRFMYSKVLILRNDLSKFSVKTGPNPFAGNINVFYQLEKEETLQIRLYDQAGRTVKQYTTRGGAGSNTYNISDLNNLPRGNYTLELTGETVKYRQQVAKQ